MFTTRWLRSLCLAVAMCSGTAQQPAPTGSGSAQASYVVGLGDVIGVVVYGDQDLNRDFRLEGDGAIRMPYLKERILASGKTIEQLQNEIGEAYVRAGILRNPQVLVTIKEYNSSPITLVGAFTKPGVIQLTGRMTLTQALARGEGVAGNAGPTLYVLRGGYSKERGGPAEGAVQKFVIPLRDLLEDKDPSLNLTLEPGDVLSLPRADYVYIGGAVFNPGSLSMAEAEWTVLRAVVARGNVARFAKLDESVIIRRHPDGRVEEIPIPLRKILDRKAPDVKLVANDILLIPESGGRRALARALESALGIGSGLAVIRGGGR